MQNPRGAIEPILVHMSRKKGSQLGSAPKRVNFPPWVAALLENGDRQIKSNVKSRFDLYTFLRTTMAKFCRVDAFYVGFFRPNMLVSVPYTYDSGRYDDPETLTYSPDGLSAWMLKTGQVYRYVQDDGELLKRGQRFGSVEKETWDAVVAPLIDRTGISDRVIGLVSMQSYEPNSYGEVAVEALQWLADSVVVSILRTEEDRRVRSTLGVEDDRDLKWDPLTELAQRFGQSLHEVRGRLTTIAVEAESENSSIAADIREVVELCERIPTEFSELSLEPTAAAKAWALLTDQQKRVAKLIVQGLSNQDIANALCIELSTVKKHVSAILRAFEVSQRVGVMQRLSGFDL